MNVVHSSMLLFITNHFIQNKFSLKKDEEFTVVKYFDSLKSAWNEVFCLKFSMSSNV